MRIPHWFLALTVAATACVLGRAQTAAKPAAESRLPVAATSASEEAILRGGIAPWSHVSAKRISLNRTPPLFDTDEPAAAEISTAEVRLLRARGKLYVQLSWHDATRDAANLPTVPNTPPEQRFRKVPTEVDDRFFDAAAVMVPADPASAINPSLQMGDAAHPVHIYYWHSARGAMRMEAAGRATTRRTGQSFPVEAAYQNRQWVVTFEMADQPAGTPLAFAIWNGSQQDRDGRKYFSVWYSVE